jgi:EAL domain-containing protein (putative c-di-GMP-specific phosphodiesterase class I)
LQDPSYYNCSLLERIIETESIRTLFQPICSIRKQMVSGIEALSRGIDPDSGDLISPLVLFDLARRENLLIELDRVCRHKALEQFSNIQHKYPGLALFLNLDSAILDSNERKSGLLDQVIEAMGIEHGRVVIELLESNVNNLQQMRDFVEERKKSGFLIGLDDLGAGHSNLSRVPMVQPNIIKIDRGIVNGLEDDYFKREIFDICVLLAHRIGAIVVAEGIETEAQAFEAVNRGADLLQGYYLAKPQEFSDTLIDSAFLRTKVLAAGFRDLAIQKAHDKREESKHHGRISSEIISFVKQASNGDLVSQLEKAVESEFVIECVYVLDNNGIQITPTVFNKIHQPSRTKVLFHPAEQGADHSLKEYVIFLRTGLEQYLTTPYISSASGKFTRTLSVANRHEDYGDIIVCIDFYPQA